MSEFTRSDMKKFFSDILKETSTPSLEDIKSAQKSLRTRDVSSIASYLGAHEDEVADILAQDTTGMAEMMPIGGGLGRGLPQARLNLKKALEALYQEVVDGLTDEYDPRGEGVMADQTMGMAAQDTKHEISTIVSSFLRNITPPRNY